MGIAPLVLALASSSLIAGGATVRNQLQKAKKGATVEAQAKTAEVAKAADIAEKLAISNKSKIDQADKARKRTIFAGSEIEKQIFRKTLGGGVGAQTLGQ